MGPHTFNPFFDRWTSDKAKEGLSTFDLEDPVAFCEQHLQADTIERLGIFRSQLIKWNGKNQLVAHSTLNSIWTRHIIDSAQLFRLRPSCPYRWVDIGTGGGFPGLILAILAMEQPDEDVFYLVESNRYKAEFLSHVAHLTGTNVVICRDRVEHLESLAADVISARAVAGLSRLIGWSHRHLRDEEGYCLFPKGPGQGGEVDEARRMWNFDMARVWSWTQPASSILRINGIKPVRTPK